MNEKNTDEDVLKALRYLKNGKACFNDMILNEFLKSSQDLMFPLYTNIFNLVFDTGKIPDKWAEGYIVPIYKNKGNVMESDNYSGITFLSCMGKLFTSILNNKLNDYLSRYETLGEEQAGFRKHYGTRGHIFDLKCLIDLYLCKKKKLYCEFVDYKKRLIESIELLFGRKC